MRTLVILAMLLLAFGCLGTEKNKVNAMEENTSADHAKPIPPSMMNETAPASQNSTETQNETVKTETGINNVSPTQNSSGVLMADTKFPEPMHYDFSNITTLDGKLIVYYFHNRYCGACKELQPKMDILEKKYTNVFWLNYDLAETNGSDAYLAFAGQFNLSMQQRLVPQVLVNGTIITDQFNISDRLEPLILNFTKVMVPA